MRLIVTLVMALALAGCPLQQAVKPEADPDMPADIRKVEVLAAEAYGRGDWAEAETYYRELSRRVPGEAEVWFRLGNIRAREQRPAEAVAAYREALVREPGHAKAWYNMGVLQLRQAMNSFARMQAQVPPGDPLHDRGAQVYDGLRALVGAGE